MRRMLPSALLLLPTLLLTILHPTSSHLSSGPHIADVNILLPPKMTHPVEYRLKGSDGCFKWTWDHHDVLSVLPEYNSSNRCSTSARLKSIAPYSGRKETAVYATDMNSGIVIRCKVYIDTISRIQIFHNSVKLDLDGLSALRVRAFDSEENVFSSLVGLQFSWQLMPEVDGLPHHLAHIPLKESPLTDCGGLCGDLDIQVKLEESGVYSDLYLVKGNEIGHEMVSVHLLEPSIQHLEDKIILTVAEAMSLDPPSPVLVLVGAVVNYNLKVIRGNSPNVVSLPSPFHQWSVLNSSVALIESKIGEVKALEIGNTAVIVEDTRVVGHMQTSSFHVVLPDSLLMFIHPLSLSEELTDGAMGISSVSRWYVVSGRQYLIHVKVLSSGPVAREIYITESDDIRVHDSDPEFCNTTPVSEDIATKINYRILNANLYGLGKLTATLFYSSGQGTRKEVLKTVQEVMVCNQIQFKMGSSVSERILLPWVPGVYQELELKASGGCATSSRDYKWFSSDMSVISVSSSGTVRAIKPGIVTIRAVSVFDSLNYDELTVEVTFPSSIMVLPDFPVETSVGTHLQASVTFKSASGSTFYACDAFRSSVRWKTESGSFVIVNGEIDSKFSIEPETIEHQSFSYGPPCAWTLLYAANHGRTVVHATLSKENLQFDHSGTSTFVLKTSFPVTAYLPLIVHQASDGNQFGGYWFDLVDAQSQNQLNNLDYLYLTPGTFMDLMLYGGPERWDHNVEFIETVEALEEHNLKVEDKVIIYQMSTILGNTYKIGCIDLGTFKLVFRRGNLIGKDHPLPTVAEVSLSLVCGIPSAIVIIADEPLNKPQILRSAAQAERMHGGIRVSPVTVANDRRIRVSSVGISDSGIAFANSSSLDLNWELAECEGLVLEDDDCSLSIAKSSWERFFILQNLSGVCIIRATVVGLSDSIGYLDFSGMLRSSSNSLTDAIKLQLVSSLRVTPEFSLLLFNLDARLNLSVTGGSSFLDVTTNNTEVVEVKQQSPVYECSHLIVAPRRLGSALVTVHDIGLLPPLVASSTVQVADIGWIKIITGEHISIVLGGIQSINFLVGAGDGLTFDHSQYIYMNICVHVEEDTVELSKNYDSRFLEDGCVHAPNFTVQATHLGVTNMYLSTIQHSGLEIRSKSVKVEVYAPPKILPSEIFLVPGASFVLTLSGGPKFGSHVQYTSRDGQIAQVHESSGLLSAVSPGNSTIVATVYGNGNVQLCRVQVLVRVGIPSSAVLSVQSEHLAEGRSMQIHPSLSQGNLFSFYELCKNFEWSIADERILSFREANNAQEVEHDDTRTFRYTGSLDEKDYNFIQVLYGKSTGKTTVTLSFSCTFKISGSLSKPVVFSASRLLSVVPNLPLARGVPVTWILPPHYTSSDILPLFSHRNNDKNFQNDAVSISYSLLSQCKRMTVEQHDTSISIRGAKIITKGFDNLECIQAKDESTGITEVASCVKVAEVAQVRILTNQFPVHTLAVDAELDLFINYHDAFGNPFHEAHNISLIEAETNNPDVISIKSADGSGKIHILGKSRGIALLRLYFTSMPQKSEYIVISVGPQLYPHNPVLYQGSKIDFSVKGLSDFALGQWFSDNTSILHLDSLSGKAEALRGGRTAVHFKGLSLKLHTKVTVLERETVLVEAPKEILTNAPFPRKYLFSVKFNDAYMTNFESLADKTALLLDCSVDPPFIGFSRPWRNLETGDYYCLFYPYSPENLALSATNSGGIGHPISVSVRASLKGNHLISGSATAPFIGGFTILEMEQRSLHLNMTKTSDNSVVTLIGNTNDININWSEKDRLSVKPLHKGDIMEGNHIQYVIKVYGSESFRDQVVFSLRATDQRAVIDVSYEPWERKSWSDVESVSSWVGVAGVFLMLILVVTLLICCLDKPERTKPFVAFGTPSGTAPATPERTSSAVTNNQSPRTPQPFIDYVRMTLDETPYYRRDFRRRNNPQNTY